MSLAARTSPTGTAVTTHVLHSRGRPIADDHVFLAERLLAVPGRLSVEEQCAQTGSSWRGITMTFVATQEALALTAAIADGVGAAVHEEEHSWSAIEPIRDLWPSVPGAHLRWSARTFGLLLVVEGRRAITSAEIEKIQGLYGWSLDHEIEDGLTTVTFVHAEDAHERV